MSTSLTSPDGDEFLTEFGVAPTLEEPDEGLYSLDLVISDVEKVTFSYSVIGRSMRCRWFIGERLGADLFREGVSSIAIKSAKGSTSLIVESATGGLAGTLELRIYPEFALEDRLLYV